jgi:aminoglycoside phosphotransferase (APT) family kinase protein
MTAPPVATHLDRASLVAALATEDRNLDLAGVQLHSGWENVVVETRDGWILRFPREEHHAFDRELAILARVHGRLPAQTPKVEWTGRHTRFAAYRKLRGAEFDPDAYAAAPVRRRDRTARSLAEFLVAMHGLFTVAEAAELGLPGSHHETCLDEVSARIDEIPASSKAAVGALVEEFARTWVEAAVPGPDVVLHNDFHTSNLVLSTPVGEVIGVWDFSCVQIGVPTFDLRYFEDGPPDLLDRLAGHYRELTGRTVDVAAAVVANRMESVCDALTTGQADQVAAMAARWRNGPPAQMRTNW